MYHDTEINKYIFYSSLYMVNQSKVIMGNFSKMLLKFVVMLVVILSTLMGTTQGREIVQGITNAELGYSYHPNRKVPSPSCCPEHQVCCEPNTLKP